MNSGIEYSSRVAPFSWSAILRGLILPIGDIALGQGIMKRLRFLEQAQWWKPERLHEERDKQIVALIKTAYDEVPFYRALLDQSGVHPSNIRGISDLSKIPAVSKDMLTSSYPEKTTRNTGRNTYEVSTSGSTGKNFRVTEDSETAGSYRASFMLALEWAGWTIGEPHLQTGMTLNRSLDRWLKDTFLRCHYVSAFDLSDARLDENLEILAKHKLKYLWGYPGSLYYLAKRALERGFDHTLRSAVTWGDTLYPHYRAAIEKAFNTRVYDTYGCGEGIQISAQCGVGNHYHIHTLDTVVEFVDEKGMEVKRGTPANILVTRLHPGPMPLIRYQIGDIGRASEYQSCECGRGFDLMESIQGRDTDVVITPSGNRLIVHFFTGILENFTEIESFQVVQEELDSIYLRIVPTHEYSHDSDARIIQALKEKGATGINIMIERVAEIPVQSSGKRRFIISKIAKPDLGGKQQK